MPGIEITPNLAIDESEIVEQFVRSGGPGGQNVNRVSTAVQLRFDVTHSRSLAEEVRQRLMALAGSQMTDDGVLVITARSHRTQRQNRVEARERLVALIRRAAQHPKRRVRTRPRRAAVERRLEEKRRRAEKKARRRWRPR